MAALTLKAGMGFSSEIEKLERRWQDNPLGLTFVPFAEALRKAGEPARALELLEIGLGQHPNYVPAHIVRGRCHLDGQSNDQAELAFLRVTELDPENIIALKSLADLSERVGRIPEAIRRLETLLEVDRNNEDARAQLERLRELPAPSPAAAAEPVAVAEPAAVAEPVAAAEAAEPLPAEPVAPVEMEFAPLDLEPEPEPVRAPDPSDLFPQDLSDLQIANDSDALQMTGERLEDVILGSDMDEQVESIRAASFERFDAEETEAVRDFEPEPLLPDSTSEHDHTFASILDPESASAPPFSGLEQELGMEPDPSPEAAVEEAPAPIEEPTAEAPVEEVADAPSELVAEVAYEPSAAAWQPDAPDPVVEPEPEPVAQQQPHSAEEQQAEPVAQHEAYAAEEQQPEPVAQQAAYAVEEPQPEPVAQEVHAMEEQLPEPVAEPLPEQPWEEREVAEFRQEAEFTPVPSPEPQPVYEPVGMSEPEPAEAGHVEADSSSGAAEPELVVTETMAEIFLRQGHVELARAVYAQLAQRDPSNERVSAALARLQPEPAPMAAPSPSAAVPQPQFDAAATGGKSVEQLFGSLLSALRPSVAATVHPPAFESRRRPLGEPTRPAEEALSLSSVFGEEGAPAGPAGAPARGGEPSFDEFFAPTTGPAEEVELPRAPTEAGTAQVPEDLEQFNAWLRGLKR